MMGQVWRLVALAVAVVACGGTGTDDGAASPVPSPGGPIGGPFPVADLSIVIEHPERDSIQYRLSCLGDTATVTPQDVDVDVDVDEQAACGALARPEVVSRLVDGPPADQVCTQQFGGPDVSSITGTIDDVPVDTTVDRTNGCGISDWDELLVDVLPPSAGVVDGS